MKPGMKLPHKWLRSEWVEAIATKQGHQADGDRTYNTNAIDKSGLFLWIRKNFFPNLTPQQYRLAIRVMCRDQRSDYESSPLNAELRKIHCQRIEILGKRKWGFQVNLSNKVAASQAQNLVTLGLELSGDEKSNKPHSAKVSEGVAANTVIRQYANQRLNDTPSTPPAQNTGSNNTPSAPSLYFDEMSPQDCNLDFANVFDARQAAEQQGRSEQARSIQLPFTDSDVMELMVPQTMSQAHLSVFDWGVELLKHRCMCDVPEGCYFELERSFTRCFSMPDGVSFLIQETDRFRTGRPDPYTNPQAQHLFAVNLTQEQHIIMGLDSRRQVFGNLAQAVKSNSTMAYTPGVWINTRDRDGNPCPRLADVWMPRVLFNGNKHIVMVAPSGAVSLERALPI